MLKLALAATTALTLATAAHAADPWYTQGDFAPATRVAITVKNPLNAARTNSPVVIRRADLPMLHDVHELSITLVDPDGEPRPEPDARTRALEGAHGRLKEANGRSFDYQFDDLDQDGLWDELFFMADFAAGETKTIYAYLGMQQRGWNPHRTHAGTGSYMRHTVPFWESENIGWKLWYPDSIDVYGKRKPQLMSPRLYGENLDGYAVSLIDSGLGSDIMQVASSFGGGGVGLIEDPAKPDVVSRPRFTSRASGNFNGGPVSDTRYAFTVIANGPLRSMVRIKTMNWDTGAGKYELEQVYTAYAGHDYSTATARFTRFDTTRPDVRFAVGIRKHIGEDMVVANNDLALSAAPEVIRNPDDIEKVQPDFTVDYAGNAVAMKPAYRATYVFSSANEGNHLLTAPMTPDRSFEYLLAAGWSEGAVRKTEAEFRAYVERSVREYAAPVAFVDARTETRP